MRALTPARVCSLSWESPRTAEDDEIITYRVSGPDAYAQVVPLPFAPISAFGDCWIEVTLNSETGWLRRIVDNRALVVDLWDGATEQSLTYRIETEYAAYPLGFVPQVTRRTQRGANRPPKLSTN